MLRSAFSHLLLPRTANHSPRRSSREVLYGDEYEQSPSSANHRRSIRRVRGLVRLARNGSDRRDAGSCGPFPPMCRLEAGFFAASIKKREDGRWRRATAIRLARNMLATSNAKLMPNGGSTASRPRRSGGHVDPKTARLTVDEWCRTWLTGYGSRRSSTVRQAEVHLELIVVAFGPMPMSAVQPSDVRSWTAQLKAAGRATSYVYALHARLSQVFNDAVHDGVIVRNPCSRRTSPRTGSQRPYDCNHRAGVGSA